jgi:hypothetical protein
VVRTSSPEVDRRASPRIETDTPCEVTIGGQAWGERVINLSSGGAAMTASRPVTTGSGGTLRMTALGVDLPFSVRRAEEGVMHVAFNLDAATRERLDAMLERMTTRRAA